MNPQARFSEKREINNHIFRLDEGHFILDTVHNRNLLLNTTSPRYYAGADAYGNMWYSRTGLLGSQLWVRTRNGIITDGGFNFVERAWDPISGFCNRPRK